jgi:NAD(P)-dependent dehydrogenase (short-subunit alcohol dehydrogenase family)
MRVLIVGGARRGLALAGELVAEGHAVRIAADEPRRAEIEAAGCECWVGDPDRIGSLRYALENVTALLWLLGDVDREELHGSRLEMMLERTIDTTARGVIYESFGEYGDQGAEIVVRMATKNEIPYVLVADDPADEEAWQRAVLAGLDAITSTDRAALQH